MQEKLLKEIISDFAGVGSEKLVDVLYAKKNVNEFLIAKKLDLTINQTRNMLYKLADRGLVGFIRKKDKKKGGWYTYFWTLKAKKGLLRFKEKVEKSISNFQKHLDNRKLGRYFYCKNCEIEYNEENAMLQEYACSECGEVLKMKDNSEMVNKMKNEVERLEKILAEINQDVADIEVKEGKSKDRRLKLEQKKKEEERLKRKKERERLKRKEEKRLGIKPKKKVKKKIKKSKKKGGKKVKKKPKSKKGKKSLFKRIVKGVKKRKKR